MSYKLEIRPEALSDIDEAAAWYEEREPGLGSQFARSIRAAINTLPTHPLAQRLRNRRRNVRWFLPVRFPYRIVYQVQGDLISVTAVLYAARHDQHWKERV